LLRKAKSFAKNPVLGLARSHTPRNITAVIETSSAALSESLATAPVETEAGQNPARFLPDPNFGVFRPSTTRGATKPGGGLAPICPACSAITVPGVGVHHWWLRAKVRDLETAPVPLMVMGFGIAAAAARSSCARRCAAVTILAAFTCLCRWRRSLLAKHLLLNLNSPR
jgi:hypothetical protein